MTDEQIIFLDKLKKNILEARYPIFSEEELIFICTESNWDLKNASYVALLMKAEKDDITLPSGIGFADNRQFWLTLAKRFRKNCNKIVFRGDLHG